MADDNGRGSEEGSEKVKADTDRGRVRDVALAVLPFSCCRFILVSFLQNASL